MSTTTSPTPSATTTPATVPASQVIPFPLPWGGVPCPPIPGCAPGCGPAGMDALMKCYMDIKNAMAFIAKVMIDLINNDPAVAQAMIAAIEKSGSSLPLIGVTDGSNAQPGQVGEWFLAQIGVTYPQSAGLNTQVISLGVIQPGDWDVWVWGEFGTPMDEGWIQQINVPAGFAATMAAVVAGSSATIFNLLTPTVRASVTAPSLVVVNLNTISSGNSGSGILFLAARRMR